MYRVALTREDAFEEFRDAARGLVGAGVAPADVSWRVGDDLLGSEPPPARERHLRRAGRLCAPRRGGRLPQRSGALRAAL